MTNDSIHAPTGAKTIFNKSEPTIQEELSHLTRDQLLSLCVDQEVIFICVRENASEILQSAGDAEKVSDIASGIIGTIDEDDLRHELIYSGKPRDLLLKTFPSLRSEGDAA